MKCDELKDRWFWAYPTESVDCDGIIGSAHEVYGKSEVDAAIAELKQKLEDVNELIKTARQMLEDAKASHYAEMVDAGMRERRLKRALYKACANWADRTLLICSVFGSNAPKIRWERMKDKCRAMAEKFE